MNQPADVQSRPRLRGRRLAGTGLPVVAGRRRRPGGRALRCRARVGRLRSRRRAAGLEAMARHGDEPGLRRRHQGRRARGQEGACCCAAAACAPSPRPSARPSLASRPTTSSKASRATPTATATAATRAAGACAACPGGRTERKRTYGSQPVRPPGGRPAPGGGPAHRRGRSGRAQGQPQGPHGGADRRRRSVAGVFTRNRFCAAPVQVCREAPRARRHPRAW